MDTKKEQVSPDKIWRQRIMSMSRRLGWDNNQAHAYFVQWGYGESLRALSYDNLYKLLTDMEVLAYGKIYTKQPYIKPGKPCIIPTHKSGKNMATNKQILYVGILAKRFAELKNIPADDAFTAWHRWAKRYTGEDHIVFCTKEKATKVICAMEKAFKDTFGNTEFTALTGKK